MSRFPPHALERDKQLCVVLFSSLWALFVLSVFSFVYDEARGTEFSPGARLFFLGQHPKSQVARHFLTEGHKKSTIYNMIARFYAGGPMANNKKPGRRSGISAAKRTKLKAAAKNKIGASTRKLAKKFDTSQSTVVRILKAEGVKRYKRASRPKYTEKQLQEIPGKCHYAKATLDWLTAHNIPFVRKEDNPPNVPQARPIESYWAILSQSVYENGWEATTAQQLKSRIIRCAPDQVVQTMMARVPGILRKIEDEGPLSV